MSTAQTPNTQVTTTPPKFDEGTVEAVLEKITAFQTAGELRLHPNYAPENAVRAAWLVLQETKDRNDKPVLEVCTKASIASALLEMVLKGLSVVKKQCYFVAYGTKLEMEKSYIGEVAVAKRDASVKDVNGEVIYEGDKFTYQIDPKSGRKTVISHDQSIENIDLDKIKGAYAIVEFEDGTVDTEIMTIKQIRQAWNQGAAKGNSPAHRNFPDQMAIKTVINRALKIVNGSTDDSALMANDQDTLTTGVKQEIKTQGNKKEIGFTDAEVMPNTPSELEIPAQEEPKGPNF